MGHSEWPMTQVTHWAFDPWPMWPMTHGSPGPSPHTSASLTQIYRLPGSVFWHCICVHTTLSCYIIARVSKLHTQAPVNLEFLYASLPQYISPAIKLKKMMGHGSTPTDPWPMWPTRFSWPIWPMTHRPIPCPAVSDCQTTIGVIYFLYFFFKNTFPYHSSPVKEAGI